MTAARSRLGALLRAAIITVAAGAPHHGPRHHSWSAGNPFATAPIHVMQLLALRVTSMGADDSDGLVCVSTFRGQGPASAADVVLTAAGGGMCRCPRRRAPGRASACARAG